MAYILQQDPIPSLGESMTLNVDNNSWSVPGQTVAVYYSNGITLIGYFIVEMSYNANETYLIQVNNDPIYSSYNATPSTPIPIGSIIGPGAPLGGGGSGTQGPIGPQGNTGVQGFTGFQGSTGSQGLQGPCCSVTGSTGPQGFQGATGSNGSSATIFNYKIKTTIISGDPLNRHIIYNNATQISSTQLNISHIDDDSTDIDLFLALLTPGDILYLQEDNDSNNFQKWIVNGLIVIQTGYVEVPVAFISSGGTGTTNFNNTLQVILAMFLIGSEGPQGNTGSTGPQGSQGVEGFQGFQGYQGFQGFIGTTGGFGLTYSGINTQLAYFNSTTGLTSSSQMIFDGTNLIIGTGTSIIGGTSTGSILTLHATSASSSTALSNAFIFKYTPSIEAMRLGGNLTGTETYVCFNGTSNLSGGSANYFIRTGTNAGGFVYMNALSDFRLRVAGTDYIIMTSGTGIISARKPLTMFTAMKLTLAAGTTTVQPLLFQSGTNLTTGVAGSMEYNGTNFFLTRTGTTREGILTVSATSSVSPTSPNLTLTVNIGGQTYYIPAKTTND